MIAPSTRPKLRAPTPPDDALLASDRRVRNALFALVAAALIVRLAFLASQSMLADEGYTLAYTQRGFVGMLHQLGGEGNGILYQILVYPLVQVSDSLVWLRLPAALAGAAAVPALYWAARAYVDRATSMTAALLLLINPTVQWHSHNGRSYTFAMLATIVALGALPRALRGERRLWAIYVLAVVAASYSNALAGVLLVPVHLLVVLRHGPGALRAWLAPLVSIGVLVSPLAVILARASGRYDPFYWASAPSIHEFVTTVTRFLGDGYGRPRVIGPAAALLAALLVLLALVRPRQPLPRGVRAYLRHPLAPIVGWTFVPFASLFAISQIIPVYNSTYLLVCVPGACILVAAALRLLPGRTWRVSALSALLILSALAIVEQQRRQVISDYRSAAAVAVAGRAPGEPVLVDSAQVILPLGYYAPALRSTNGELYVPHWHDAPAPRDVALLQNPGAYFTVPDGPPSEKLVRSLVARTGGMRAVIANTHDQGDVHRDVGFAWARRACTMGEREFVGVLVISLSHCRV